MLKRLSQDEAKRRTLKHGHQLVGPYTSVINRHDVICLDCSHPRKVRLNNLWRGQSRCPRCNPDARISNAGQYAGPLTAEIVNDRLRKARKPLSLVGPYGGYRGYSTFQCDAHGHQWRTKNSYTVISGNAGCPFCRLLDKGIDNFTTTPVSPDKPQPQPSPSAAPQQPATFKDRAEYLKQQRLREKQARIRERIKFQRAKRQKQ